MSVQGMSSTTGKDLDGLGHLTQSLRDILATRIGTRVYRRDYGSLIPSLVDRPVNDSLIADMRAAVADAIDRWEPRVKLTKVQIRAVDPGSVTMDLTMDYVVDGKTVFIEGFTI